MIIIEILFWVFVLAVFHSYVSFPLSLQFLSLFRKYKFEEYEPIELPHISILMAVYNEEKVIVEKLDSIKNANYPAEKIELIIGSDNSSDATNSIIEKYLPENPGWKFKNFTKRQGKPNIINLLEENASGEILILTDANVILKPNTLYELVKYFKVTEIGLVDANMVNKGLSSDGISFQEKAYISREVKIKNMEGKLWGSMMGPFGGCFAMRKSLYEKVPENYLVDDFYLSMKVLEKNYKAINNVNAIVYEDVSNDLKEEFRRKIRIATGNFQNLASFRRLLFKKRGIGYCFFSHKVLRWLGPLFIIFALLTSYYLGTESSFYSYVFYIQLVTFLFPFIDYLLRIIGLHIIILRFITHFYSMNLALLIGFYKYTKGVKSNVWQPTKRNQ